MVENLQKIIYRYVCQIEYRSSNHCGESPFGNRTAERHKILAEAMQKTLALVKCGLDIVLAWAVRAKNALQNCGGYSPNQLMIGRIVNISNVLEDKLPALESNTSDDIIHKSLEALHSTRKIFYPGRGSRERIKPHSHQTLRCLKSGVV